MIKFLLGDKHQFACIIEDKIHENISCKKAFPLESNIFENIGVYNEHGQEIYWLDTLSDIKEDEKKIVLASLKEQFFFINIQKIISVSSPFFPNKWLVLGDDEHYSFEMNDSEDFFSYQKHGILIRDSKGCFYLLPPLETLDEKSQKKLLQFI
jgi:hypothetical protein